MKEVEICLLRKFLGNEAIFVTEHEYIVRYKDNPNWIADFMRVDIPDRFHPKEDEEGRVIVTVGGKTVSLSNVLGIGKNGDPVIEWLDEEGGFKRTVSLKVHPAATFKNGSGFYNYANGEEIEVQPDGQK